MDFAAKLRSPSVRDHADAAIFLQAEGANGAEHLSALLQKCQSIDLTRVLDRAEETLLGVGAMTMGSIVGAVGFDPENALHISILHWILNLTSSSSVKVAVYSIYGLGNLGVCRTEVIERLSSLVNSERRIDDHEIVSLRGIALRILARLDVETAAMFVDTLAFEEYGRALEYWMSSSSSDNEDVMRELLEERDWLAKARELRTTE